MEDGHTPTSTEFVSHFYPTSGVAGRSISSFVPEDELERQRLAALAKRKVSCVLSSDKRTALLIALV